MNPNRHYALGPEGTLSWGKVMQLGGNAGVCLALSSPSWALFFSSLITALSLKSKLEYHGTVQG